MARSRAGTGGAGKPRTKKDKAAGKAKPAAAAAKPEPSTAVHPSEVRRVTTPADFSALARRCSQAQEQISEYSGSMGELIREAAEKKNLHKGAFSLWRKLHTMYKKKGGASLAEFLAHFDYYRSLPVQIGRRDYPSLDDGAKEQGDMVGHNPGGEGGEEQGGEAGETAPGTPSGETDQRPRFKVHDGGTNGAAAAPEKEKATA